MSLIPPLEFKDPACKESNEEVFFLKDRDEVEEGETIRQSDYDIAKKVCSTCPCIKDCLAWGLKYEEYGIWGGTTPRQRIELKMYRTSFRRENLSNPM